MEKEIDANARDILNERREKKWDRLEKEEGETEEEYPAYSTTQERRPGSSRSP